MSIDQDTDKLFKQIEIFEKHARDNFQELDSQMENIEGVWDDTKSVFEYIYNMIKGTPAELSLQSIFQHLLLIRDDTFIRNSYFRLIEECSIKIVLFKDGRDPDFEYGSKFDLDVDNLISENLKFKLAFIKKLFFFYRFQKRLHQLKAEIQVLTVNYQWQTQKSLRTPYRRSKSSMPKFKRSQPS